MGYIGNQTSNSYTSLDKQTITGDGGASYTLDHAVANEQEIEVFVNNVRQEPSVAYTVSNNTLSMAGNVEASDDFYVVFQGKAILTTSHPEGQDLKARDGYFSGDLGVGVSDPAYTVDVASSGNTQIHLKASGQADGLEVGQLSADGGSSITATNNNYLKFGTNNTERMRIDSGGNVGIGTASPESLTNYKQLTVGNSSTERGVINATDGTVKASVWTTNSGIARLGSRTNHPVTLETNGAERLRFDTSGHILFGKTTTDANTQGGFMNQNGLIFLTRSGDTSFLLNRTTNNGYVAQFRRDNSNVGGISVTTSATSFVTSSDHRLKENAVDMTGAIARVKNLQPKRFNFIADDTDTLVDGFMAHEAQTVVPEAVTGTHNEVDADGNAVYQGIDQAKLVPLLTCALQEAIAKIEALETRVQALEDA